MFDRIFTSAELGYEKPDKETYLSVLDAFGVKPNEAVFVAHDEDELVGAKKLGIKTISYQGHESGDFVVQKFEDIPKVLKEIEK
jgi:putative hydrolase of the HAD superfamily